MLRKLRVCIVTPGALGSNPRTVKEAQALDEWGHDVTVVSTRTSTEDDRRDETILAAASWRVIRLDFTARGGAWQLRRAAQEAGAFAFSIARCAGFAGRAFSPFTRPLAAAAKGVLADLYIAHYPAALPAAAMAARHHGALYAFDAEDFHLGDWPEESAHKLKRRLTRAIEGRYLPGCAYLTAASPGIADAYANAYGIARPTVVLNVFPRAEAPPNPTPKGSAVPAPSVYWFSQTIGPDRGLECAVRAIGRARTQPHLYLRGTPALGFVKRLQSIAATVGAAERLHILPPAAPSEMERLAASHDVGFVGETGCTSSRRVALTNKLFTYLLAGLPVVMSDIPAHRAIAPEISNAGRLYTTNDVDGLAAVLDALLGNPADLAAARSAAFRLGQNRFNWDLEKSTLLNLTRFDLSEKSDARLR